MKSFKNLFSNLVVLLLFNACATSGHESTKNILEGNENALRGDYSIAISRYEKALETNSESQPAKRNLGIVLVKVGNYKRARDLLESVKVAYEKDSEFLYFYGESLRGSGDLKMAATVFKSAIESAPKDLRIVKAQAWTWHKLGKHEKSIEMVKPFLAEFPGDSQLRLIIGSAYLKLKRFEDGISSMRMFENLKSSESESAVTSSERSLILTVLAQNYLGLSDCNRASPLFQEVLRSRPFLAEALTGAARCDIVKKSYQKALVKLDRATKTDPDLEEAHYLLGRLVEKTDPPRAIFLLRRFLLLSKSKVETRTEQNLAKKAIAEIEQKSQKK